ncbi:TetR/AcrR family transcriptional regulator [Amycolatopsis sp.]|jgi:AcrR family transcriptional regulator|uniref:TetR/AcrR family transcriptional regulator n=1 Tax=Amycolatopsis sp. TaxID=37632 RepID=UPI002DF85F8E|nr:TetR/AcrR family transcriptional regulator [Amycolatopsis sp.]
MTDRIATRKRELVEAAYKVFCTKGYRTSGVADIVRETGVSHGTFYNYYDSKRHILDDVLDYAVESIIEGVVGEDQPNEATSLDELAGQFRVMLDRLLTLVEGKPGLVQFTMLDTPAIDDELVQRLLTLISSFGVLTTAYLDNGVRRGFLPADLDTKIAGQGLLSLMMYSVVPTLRGPLVEPERTRHIDALVGFAFNGMAARS